jgi:hypothetical protein
MRLYSLKEIEQLVEASTTRAELTRIADIITDKKHHYSLDDLDKIRVLIKEKW